MARQKLQEGQVQELTTALAQLTRNMRAQLPPSPGTELVPVGKRVPPRVPGDRRDRHGRFRAPNKLTLAEGVRSLAHRNRRQLRPWIAMLGVLAVAYLAALAGELTGREALVGWLATTAVITTGAVLAAVVVRKRLGVYWLSWSLAAIVAVSVWTSFTAFHGPDYVGFVVLFAGTVLFGLRWWKHVRHPYPVADRTVEEPVDDATEGARLLEDWRTKAASRGGPAPGATLVHLEPYEHGHTGIVQLVRGRQSLADIQAALPKLSTALDVSQENLIFETHPDGPPSRLRMQVVTRSPVKQTVFFDQPVYRDGRILLGPYADGIGDATFVLYTEDSMESGYVLGSKGSGKSRIIETVALSAIWSTPTVVLYIDGQNGASSPLLWQHALWRGGQDDADEILRSVLAIKEYRQLYNRKHRLTGFAPSAELPGILVIVDECHKIFTDQSSARWADLAREGRKLGIGLLAASQVTTLDAFGGGAHADALRSSLVSSNGIALRTASAVQSQVFPGLKVDLMALPRIPGFGYTVDDGDDQHRTAPFRARFLIDQKKASDRDDLPEGVHTAEDWFAEVAPRQRLDDRSARAAGAAFAERYERAAREQAQLDAMFAGAEPVVIRDRRSSTLEGQLSRGAAVIPFPRLEELPPSPFEPGTPEGLTDAQQAVWQAIADGVGNTADIADRLELTQRRIQVVVGELLSAGHVAKVGRGQYAVADKAGQRSRA